MRHGHRGAAEIAQSLDNLYCFAALTDAVSSAQFDLMSTRRSATTPCERFWSGLIARPRLTWRACSRRRRGAASGYAPQFERTHSGGGRRGGRISVLAPPKGLVSGRLTADGAGDGLIARVRPRRGRLSLDEAAAVAESALRCGNGAIGPRRTAIFTCGG